MRDMSKFSNRVHESRDPRQIGYTNLYLFTIIQTLSRPPHMPQEKIF